MDSLGEFLRQYFLVDLSVVLEDGVPYYPTHSPYKHVIWESPHLGHPAYSYALFLDEHTGTHVDSTAHFPNTGRRWIDEIPIEEFMGNCAVLDCKDKSPGGLVSPDDVRVWESKHGKVEGKRAVLFNFGWYEKWKLLPEGRAYLDSWPGLSKEAADYLVASGVTLVGCDTIAIDAHGASGFPAHHVLLSREVKIVECLSNLDSLPPVGSFFVAVPLRVKHGSGSPVRAFAFVPKRLT